MILSRVNCLELIQLRMRRVIWLQTPTVLRQGGENISFSSSMYIGLMMLRQTDIHTAETLVREPSA